MDLKDTYTSVFLKAAGVETNDTKFKEYKAAWWFNFRKKDSGGLRLTDQGAEFIEKYAKIKTYKIEFPADFSITPQVLIWLDRYIDSPFFITKKSITVLKEKAAFELYLFSGDIRKMGYNKALNKRLAQEFPQ